MGRPPPQLQRSQQCPAICGVTVSDIQPLFICPMYSCLVAASLRSRSSTQSLEPSLHSTDSLTLVITDVGQRCVIENARSGVPNGQKNAKQRAVFLVLLHMAAQTFRIFK